MIFFVRHDPMHLLGCLVTSQASLKRVRLEIDDAEIGRQAQPIATLRITPRLEFLRVRSLVEVVFVFRGDCRPSNWLAAFQVGDSAAEQDAAAKLENNIVLEL